MLAGVKQHSSFSPSHLFLSYTSCSLSVHGGDITLDVTFIIIHSHSNKVKFYTETPTRIYTCIHARTDTQAEASIRNSYEFLTAAKSFSNPPRSSKRSSEAAMVEGITEDEAANKKP